MVVKASLDVRLEGVLLSEGKVKTVGEICGIYSVSERTFRRWRRAYRLGGVVGLTPKSTAPKRLANSTPESLTERIVRLKQKHPCWGARRIKFQYGLPVHWKTVHNVIRREGLLVRVKAKPQPSRRFQRKHADSLWQADTFEFRIRGVGKVYVTGYTDDRSRYRLVSKAYLHKSKNEAVNSLQWALRNGRIPKAIYLDNGKQFIAKDFKNEAKKHNIKLIYGKPHNPQGRGKIEGYHKILHRELITQIEFKSLSHFRKELHKFDRKYNHWRKQQTHGWQTPAEIYNNPQYFNQDYKNKIKSGQMSLQQKRT